MAEFLTTTGVSHHIEQMIDKAEKWLAFISPYWRTNQRLRQKLGLKFESSFPAWLIYGKVEMKEYEEKWWKQFSCVQIGYLENLHSKCYLSEQVAIVTSMNLHDFSQQNNNEMGILLTKKDDKELYDAVVKYTGEMIAYSDTSKAVKEGWTKASSVPRASVTTNRGLDDLLAAAPLAENQWVKQPPKVATVKKRYGFCIRCQEEIKPNMDWPYCLPHKRSWKEWNREEYQENHCHGCGKPWPTIRLEPLCDKCSRRFAKHDDIFLK